MSIKIPENIDIKSLSCKIDKEYRSADCVINWTEKDLFGKDSPHNILTSATDVHITKDCILYSEIFAHSGMMRVTYKFKENVRCNEEYFESLAENHITCKINKNK